MKSLLFASLFCVLLSFIPVKSNPPDPNRKYKVTLELTLNEANTLVSTIAQSDQISAKFSTQINQSISYQINLQITQDAEKEKKQDSLKANTSPNKAK